MAKKVKQVSTNRPKRPRVTAQQMAAAREKVRQGRTQGAKARPEILLPGRNARAQSRREFAAEIAKRRADQADPNNTLLSPDEVAGNYILERGLFTSLGGVPRPLTLDDLRVFAGNVRDLKMKAAKAKMRGGIRAKQVIDKSWPADRERAHKDIKTAHPTHYQAITEGGGQGTSLMVHFVTNAGPDSKYSHHNVNVQFLDFGAAVASPVEPAKIVKELTGGRLKFECSCPRFKYFFRYVCTQAEIVAGRAELAFPKITNPRLTGISCKHGLRVMQMVDSSPTFRAYMVKVIKKFREDIEHVEGVERADDLREFMTKQRKENWRQRAVRTTEQKRAARGPAARQRDREREKAIRKERQAMERNRKQAVATIERNARQLLAIGAISQQQFDQMMQAARGE